VTSSTVAAVPSLGLSDIYAQVQQFYAGQVRALDTLRADDFADSFTEDGIFDNRPGADPLVGRAAIAAAVRTYQDTLQATDPVQRRHWFNMLQVFPQDDSTVRTEYYALVLQTRPSVREPAVGPSCFVTDILTFRDGGLATAFRKVVPDHTL
jgi:actinorhodin biosynthesis protein ActVIA